ncbi:uncharacterized protein LOC127003722 [Eriocheir sinensis]|uniref:uncharacterized protein LOC127003722 n=1 Tax=Eriocheir sinensis TaxID=95602 RepID=UPI0021C6EED9|nr:uncharacterized protein LOC127003722 [Eriocheir sinensis]
MMRAHKLLQEAGEVVFVDATSCVDQVNTAVIPLLCSGPAGAVPLAVLFTSSQDEATLTKGFGMVKEAIGEDGFFGQGGPQNFMTDNCNAERNALAAIWPNSKQYLCIFHVLQQVWRWLLDSKHGINKNDRQELMSAVKLLLHAESIDRFEDQLEKVQHHPLLQKYPNFKSYLNTLDQRREEWAIAYRAGALLRGHNTNNYCESTMCIIKDNVLNRCKAYNTAQLVMFMAEIFNSFMKQRIVDVALNRRHTKRMNVTKLPLESVVPLGSGLYRVGSETNPGQMYEVDLNIGICTCTKGNTGAVCKHQAVCADSANLTVPQMPMLNSNTRHQLAVLALGQKDAPSENFFKTLKEIKSDEASKSNIEAAVKFGKSEEACELNFEVKGDAEEISPSCSMETASVSSQTSSDHGGSSSLADNIHDETNIAVAELLKTSKKFGNEDSVSALKMFVQRLRSVKTSNQFNSFLHTVGVGVCVQKGAKRPRNLAENVRNNVANAKSHGSGH